MDQDEEDSLEHILGVVLVAQSRTADAQYHRTMTLDQRREGQLGQIIATRAVYEPLQELMVRQLGADALAEDRTDVPQDTAVLFDCHRIDLGPALPKDQCNAAKPADGSHIFSRVARSTQKPGERPRWRARRAPGADASSQGLAESLGCKPLVIQVQFALFSPHQSRFIDGCRLKTGCFLVLTTGLNSSHGA
jgi:hypothetical protein